MLANRPPPDRSPSPLRAVWPVVLYVVVWSFLGALAAQRDTPRWLHDVALVASWVLAAPVLLVVGALALVTLGMALVACLAAVLAIPLALFGGLGPGGGDDDIGHGAGTLGVGRDG